MLSLRNQREREEIMSNELAKQLTWEGVVNEVMPQFNQIAEREKLVIWKAESQFALQALNKNDTLAKCNPLTVQSAIINVAAVGLTLNPVDAYAYLVPRKGECTLAISFKGLIKVATDAGGIAWVRAEVVKKEDTFVFKGVSELPQHDMQPFSDRGDTVGVYCVAKTTEGDYLVDIMSSEEIAKIRDCAMTKAVWDKWPDEMSKKAIIKRASKQWPRTDTSPRLHKAIEVINEVEGFDPNYTIYTEEQKKHFDYLIEKEDAYNYALFIKSISQDIQTALFNSFEKGFKTKNKDKCRKLSADGHEILNSLIEQANEFCREGDAFGLAETITDLGDEGKAIWWHDASEETRKAATDLMATVEE